MRQHHGDDAVLLGFSTFSGSVTAADDWGGPARRMRVRPGLAGSYEALFHAVSEEGLPRFWLDLHAPDTPPLLGELRLQRAIGVIYRPKTERFSHYFHSRLRNQFDAIIHIDETTAVQPIEPSVGQDSAEPPETFSSGV